MKKLLLALVIIAAVLLIFGVTMTSITGNLIWISFVGAVVPLMIIFFNKAADKKEIEERIKKMRENKKNEI